MAVKLVISPGLRCDFAQSASRSPLCKPPRSVLNYASKVCTKHGAADQPIKVPGGLYDALRSGYGFDMTTFDERENAFEAKFARDEELRFKATARRDRALGLWAATQLGLSGIEAEDYARDVLRTDFRRPGADADVIAKVLGDLQAKGIAIDERTIKRKLIDLMTRAVADIEAGK